jgi:uncharacterized protein YcgI (DUF1989 family)
MAPETVEISGRSGDHRLLRVQMDLILTFSAGPRHIVPANGPDCIPKEPHYQILPGGREMRTFVRSSRLHEVPTFAVARSIHASLTTIALGS